VVTGFSYTSNPNGVWTYDYNLGTETPYTSGQGASNQLGTGLPGWWTGVTCCPPPESLIILQNTTGSTVNFSTVHVPTNNLWLDPESGNVSITFTAPSAGTYSVSGNFLGVDVNENSLLIEILDNGSVAWSGTLTSYEQDEPFNFSESLNTGGTITFEVAEGTGTYGGCVYCYLGTGLDASISATPELSSVLLFGSGLLGLIPLLRRKRFRHS